MDRHWLRCARHAWQRLGDMNPEMAMEKYMDLLSEQIPGWTRETIIVSYFSKNVNLLIILIFP